jgi:hypothetical protein
VHSGLAATLFDKRLLLRNMEIEAAIAAAALGNVNTITVNGFFHVKSVFKDENHDVMILGASTSDGKERLIHSDNVIGIDGMTPSRFAAVYNVAPDGGPKRAGKRRGRKPKVRIPVQ